MDRHEAHNRAKLHRLLGTLKDGRSLLIVLQDHPDPDAIACAGALRRLVLERLPHVSCSLLHGGPVGRAENRALIEYLGLKLHQPGALDPATFDRIALLDTQPGTGNNALAVDLRPHIVIDHHPTRKAARGLPFTDIRSSYGATSTILCGYLQAAGIEPDTKLATALLYGIRSDTQDLAREARKPDLDAHLYLYPRANLRMLAAIEHSALPLHYFRLLRTALERAQRADSALAVPLGRVDNPDMMGEIADLLVRLEGVTWCLCTGTIGGRMLLSLRCRPINGEKVTADHVAQRTVARDGTAGGHQRIAGGQVPLVKDTDTEIARLERLLAARFLRAVHQQRAEIKSLL